MHQSQGHSSILDFDRMFKPGTNVDGTIRTGVSRAQVVNQSSPTNQHHSTSQQVGQQSPHAVEHFCKRIKVLRQIPVADLQETAHLSGREVKTLFS